MISNCSRTDVSANSGLALTERRNGAGATAVRPGRSRLPDLEQLRPCPAPSGTDGVTLRDTAPASGWRRVFADWTVVGAATAVCHVLGALTSVLLRMFLDPARMGIWQALRIFLSYGNYANLGISKGAAREFTVGLGRGDTRAEGRGLSLAFTVNTVTSVIYGAVLCGSALWIALAGDGPLSGSWAVGLVVIAGLAVLSRYVTFHVTILRAKQAFRTTSQLAVLEAALTLAVCGLATWWFGLAGLYAGTVMVMLATLLFVVRHRAVTLTWAWEHAEIRRLVRIGAPILLAGTVSSLFRSLDKLMILGYLSDCEFQLGCYSLALMVSAQLYGFGNMLAMVMAPRYGQKFGQSGDIGQVARLAARSTEIMAAVVALPAALAVVVAAPILGRLLPDYQLGLPPLVWLVPGVVALSLALPASQCLIAVNRQGRALWTVVFGTAVAAVGNHVALSRGYGLVGVAAATTAGYACYFVVVVAVSVWPQLDRLDRIRYTTGLILLTMPALAVAILAEWLWPGTQTGWASLAVKAGAVVLVWSFTAGAAWHFGRWRDVFAKPGSVE